MIQTRRRHSPHRMMPRSRQLLLFLWECSVVHSFYVSYEKPWNYRVGESVPILSNKLTSSLALTSLDYAVVPWGGQWDPRFNVPWHPTSLWKRAAQALHGDAWWSGPFLPIRVQRDVYCGKYALWLENGNVDDNNNNTTASDRSSTATRTEEKAQIWRQAIERDFHYQFRVDDLPVALRTEDDSTVTLNYWQGIPVGFLDDQDQAYVYNHLNWYVYYWAADANAEDHRHIVRVVVQPFSVWHEINNDTTSIDQVTWLNPMPSCNPSSTTPVHTDYNMTQQMYWQPAQGQVLFTYDVIWVLEESSSDPFNQRWDVFLTLDQGVPEALKLVGIFVSIIITAILMGTLWTWIMRDLSYKPVVVPSVLETELREEIGGAEDEELPEEAVEEARMWPLNSRIFFPPAFSPLALSVVCGTGCQILLTAAVYVILFRVGIINQSADTITPAALIYSVLGLFGGYTTGRFHVVWHGIRPRLWRAALLTSTAYPLLGLIILPLVYDVLPPPNAPNYRVLHAIVPLLLVWILGMIPITLGGAWYGYRCGPIQNFPVSSGSAGYQDLALQDEDGEGGHTLDKTLRRRCRFCRRYRLAILFLTAGVLPLIGAFVSYSYGVAGPIYIGYYSDSSSFMIASFFLFIMASGAVSALFYYRQIRAQNYLWWWASFAAGGSSGFYIFVLSLTWVLFNLEHITARVAILYMLWFGYLSVGIVCMTGFVGVLSCAWLNYALYSTVVKYAD